MPTDTERLDWLIGHSYGAKPITVDHEGWWIRGGVPMNHRGPHGTYRDAIDAAMRAEQEEQDDA